MGQVIYILDTNLITDIFKKNYSVINEINKHTGDMLCLCEVVDFEIRRGFLHKQAKTQLQSYENYIRPQFHWINLENAD